MAIRWCSEAVAGQEPVPPWLLSPSWPWCACRCCVFASECNAHVPREAVLILFSCQEQQHQNSSHQFCDRLSFVTKLLKETLQLCWNNSAWTALCLVGFSREWYISQTTKGELWFFWMGIFSPCCMTDTFYCLYRQMYVCSYGKKGKKVHSDCM